MTERLQQRYYTRSHMVYFEEPGCRQLVSQINPNNLWNFNPSPDLLLLQLIKLAPVRMCSLLPIKIIHVLIVVSISGTL